MPTDIVEQLETLIVGNQFTMCNKQKQVDDHFKSVSDSPKPKDSFQTVADATKDISLVDSLVNLLDIHMDELRLDSIDTTVASVAVSALMRNEVTQGGTSTPKHPRPSTTTPHNQVTPVGTMTPKHVHPSTSTPQAPKKKLKLKATIEKVMNMNSSDVSSLELSDSDLFLHKNECLTCST